MVNTYAEWYAKACDITIEDVQERLGRPLTPVERRWIWNVGSVMKLELVGMGFEATTSPADLERELRALEPWTEERFERDVASMVDHFPEWLGRTATEAEKAALARMEHIGALNFLAERLAQAPPADREAVVKEMLSPLH